MVSRQPVLTIALPRQSPASRYPNLCTLAYPSPATCRPFLRVVGLDHERRLPLSEEPFVVPVCRRYRRNWTEGQDHRQSRRLIGDYVRVRQVLASYDVFNAHRRVRARCDPRRPRGRRKIIETIFQLS
jgi:hypothetical protein